MSADLLAEFGQDSRPPQSSAGNPQTARSQTNPWDSAPADDDFFSSLSKPNLHSNHLATNTTPSIKQSPAPTSQHPPGFEFFNLPRHDNSDVLFDAETDTPANDEDDWGDFEGPAATPSNGQSLGVQDINRTQPPPTHQASQLDLLDSLSLHDSTEIPATTQKPRGNNVPLASFTPTPPASNLSPPEPTWDDDSFGDWGEFTDAASANPAPTQREPIPKAAAKAAPKAAPKPTPKARPQTRKPTAPKKITTAPKEPEWDDEFEDWGDFSDGPTPKAPQEKAISKPKPAPSAPSPLSFASSTPTSPPTVRPTNIPPPSVLLSLLIDIINKLKEEAVQARTTRATKDETVLRIQTTLTTAARIIAGRTLRWKRDSILSQSMRIGPAGKQGGMKLNTVNKHEDVKESQDAVEVLSLWRERSAVFNSVVQSVGQKPVPVVADPAALKVITARVDEGAIKASHACALCALKRDERVLRIDEGDVNDSFGEWWTEHWGHTGCRIFWERNKELLLQR